MTEPGSTASDGPDASDGLAGPPYPAAFHLGPGHRIVHGNPAFVAEFGTTAIGLPAREAMLDLPPKAFALMDLVLETGTPGAIVVRTRSGRRRLVVDARKDPETGETYGVRTHLRPSSD